MEKVIKIEGGHRLSGSVRISGSKNSTVALIPACVLASQPVTIFGVPNISDVSALTVLLKELNVEVIKKDEETLYIDPSNMANKPMVSNAVSKLRIKRCTSKKGELECYHYKNNCYIRH